VAEKLALKVESVRSLRQEAENQGYWTMRDGQPVLTSRGTLAMTGRYEQAWPRDRQGREVATADEAKWRESEEQARKYVLRTNEEARTGQTPPRVTGGESAGEPLDT
jgi:hypothetical protein